MRRLDYLAGSRASPASGSSRSTHRRTATTATTSRTTTASTTSTARSATSSSFMNHADGARHPRHRRPGRQPHVRPTVRGSKRRGPTKHVVLPRLVRLGRRAAEEPSRTGSSFPARRRRPGPATQGGQYYFHRFYDHQPDLNTCNPYVRAGDSRDHGLLAPARRVRVPHGRRAVPDREERSRASSGEQDFDAAEGDARLPPVARRATRSCSPKRTCRPTRACTTSATKATALQMMLNFPVNQRLFYALATADTRAADPGARADARAAGERAVGAVPAQPRRARPRPADRRAAAESVRRVRSGAAHAVVRPRHSPAAGADARQRPSPAGAGVQPAVLAARDADDAVRRRDRHGRQPSAARARVRPHADAVDQRRATAASRARAAGRSGRSSTTRSMATRG